MTWHPDPGVSMASGMAIGALLYLVASVYADPYPQRSPAMPVLPDALVQASSELQIAFDDSQAKAAAALKREEEAVAARKEAEAAKAAGNEANATLKAKTDAYVALVASTYQPPAIPPAAP